MTGAEAALGTLVGRIGGQPRPGQVEMAQAVADSLDTGEHLLVQAGTGTGKSFAYLVPAAQWSIAKGKRVLISTATLALQRQLMTKDLPTVSDALAERGERRPVTALVKGRGNYLCRLRLDDSEQASDDALFELSGRLERQAALVRRWADQTRTGDRDDLSEPIDPRVWRALSATGSECIGRQRCPAGSDCFAELARDAAETADLVVTNHSVLAIDAVGRFSILPPFDAVIVDEAHELVARFTQAGTQALTVAGLADAQRLAAGQLTTATVESCALAADGYRRELERLPSGTDHQRLPELAEPLVAALAVVRDSHHRAVAELSVPDTDNLARRQAALAAVTDIHDRAGLLLAGDDRMVVWASQDPVGLSCAPLSVATQVRDGLSASATVVGTSATMKLGGSFAATAIGWGLSGDASTHRELDVGSPFDYRKQSMLYVPTDLPDPGRGGVPAKTLERAAELVQAAGGRTLVLASSWRAVDAISEHLRAVAPNGVRILAQSRGTSVSPLVAEFAKDEPSVLVGTLSLWQGVDVPGPACSCVIIDKVPFPRPDDPVLAARSERAAAAGRSGFGAVALPHAGLLLAQGAGRLIRSGSDRGVVAILDPRVATRSYGRYLMDSLPPMWHTSDTPTVVAALRRLAGTES